MLRHGMHFAGAWYPAGADACESAIRGFEAESPDPSAPSPMAGASSPRWGVVPHAGWLYSGRLAARVFRALSDDPDIELVIVLGGHLRFGDPVLAMTEGAWETPFGDLILHAGLRTELEKLSASRQGSEAPIRLRFEDDRHQPDNSIEIQLPFVAHHYPRAELLPLRVPPGPDALAVGRLLADYLQRTGLNAVAVASTDLTHYGPAYDFEPQGRGASALHWVTTDNDPAYIDAIASGDGMRMLRVASERRNACSAGAVAALNEIARQSSARFTPLDYATSSDVTPHDSENFVGYVGGVFD